MNRWLPRIACWFDRIRDLASVLKPTRFSLVVLAVVLGVMVFSDQIQDELVAVSVDAPKLYLIGIYVALCWWAFNTFYWARFVLDFESEAAADAESSGRAARIRHLVELVPRGIGAAAFVVASIGFLSAGLPYHAFGALGIGVVVYLVFVWPRRLPKRVSTKLKSGARRLGKAFKIPPGSPLPNRDSTAPESRGQRLAAYLTIPAIPEKRVRSWRDIPPNARVLLGVNAAIWIGLLSGTIYFPAVTARLGTINIMLLGTTGWVMIGSVLVLFGKWVRLPLLTLIAVLFLVFSLFNDNHDVRQLGGQPLPRPGIDDAFKNWNAAQKSHDKLGGSPARAPVIVVATEGGGVRAAYWTAVVLSQLQEDSPNFRDRLFAISGVSGGALGAAVFDQLLGLDLSKESCTTASRFEGIETARPSGTKTPPLVKCAKDVLSHDFLAPTIGAFLYPDLLQRFLPLPLLPDRAEAIERAWEIAWDNSVPSASGGGFAKLFAPFLANAGGVRRPVLLLNGTSVNSGRRLITSNILVDDVSFPDAIDFLDRFKGTLRVSTAANNAARFPYIEPGGAYCRKDCGWDYIVDGGYFENFGSATAEDLIEHIERRSRDPKRAWIVIAISSDPELPDYPYDEFAKKCPYPYPGPKALRVAAEVTIPPVGLYNTRTARGGNATKSLRFRVAEDLHGVYIPFRMTRPKDGAAPPLGWALSDHARKSIEGDLDRCPNVEARALVKSILDGSSDRLKQPVAASR